MKHLLFLTGLTLVGTVGAVIHPFYGVLVYYILAVLRPQYLWAWGLPEEIRWSLLAAMAAMVGLLLSLPRVFFKSHWNALATMLVVFAGLMMMSTITAADQDVAVKWATEYGKIFLMAFIATVTIDRLKYVRYVSLMILLTVGYIAWEMNSLYFFDGRLDIYVHGFGGLDNNGAGLMLAMGIPFAYAFWSFSKSYTFRGVCLFLGVLMLHAMMMSYSRGAMLSTGVAVIWLLYHHRPRVQAGLLAVCLVAVVMVLAGPEIRHRFMSIEEYQSDHSAQTRLDSWEAAWKMAWDNPITGMGIRNSNLFGNNYGTDSYGRTIHSQYLQIAADCGIPSLVVYLVICGMALLNLGRVRTRAMDVEDEGGWELLKNGPDREDPKVVAALALAIQTSLITFMFGGLFLSLEVFELPWLLLVLAGSMPSLMDTEQVVKVIESSKPLYRAMRGRGHRPAEMT